MEALINQKCVACRADSSHATAAEIAEFQPQIPDWQLLERDGLRQLERVYRFKNFVEALAFANRVGKVAEEEGHHPALLIEWGKVTTTWWTHKIKGLHRNDFIMAAKTDRLYAALGLERT